MALESTSQVRSSPVLLWGILVGLYGDFNICLLFNFDPITSYLLGKHLTFQLFPHLRHLDFVIFHWEIVLLSSEKWDKHYINAPPSLLDISSRWEKLCEICTIIGGLNVSSRCTSNILLLGSVSKGILSIFGKLSSHCKLSFITVICSHHHHCIVWNMPHLCSLWCPGRDWGLSTSRRWLASSQATPLSALGTGYCSLKTLSHGSQRWAPSAIMQADN